jgi:hypothetical protein
MFLPLRGNKSAVSCSSSFYAGLFCSNTDIIISVSKRLFRGYFRYCKFPSSLGRHRRHIEIQEGARETRRERRKHKVNEPRFGRDPQI